MITSPGGFACLLTSNPLGLCSLVSGVAVLSTQAIDNILEAYDITVSTSSCKT